MSFSTCDMNIVSYICSRDMLKWAHVCLRIVTMVGEVRGPYLIIIRRHSVMKKLVLLSFLLAALSQLGMAQSIGDDLYFVPKKEKKEKTTKVERSDEQTVTVVTSDGKIRRVPASETGVATVSSKQLQAATAATVRDATGVERDVDEYNRRYTSANDEEVAYVEEEESVEPVGEWVNGFEGTQEEYEYATRLIRFRSPRVAVPVSSPLYWDLVYNWSPYDWNVYADGFYAYAFPTWSNPAWWSWHYDPWHWNYGWSWHIGWGGFGFGWGDPWFHHHHRYPYWGYYPHHYHHHGPIWTGGGGYIGGGWRDGFYYDNRRRAADRPNAVRGDRRESNTVRATRENDRGAVASRGNSSSNANRTSGRVVTGRNSDDAVRSTSNNRGFTIGDATPANGRASRNTVSRSSESSSSRSTGNYTRSSSSRSSSSGEATNSSVRSSSSRSSSSGSVSGSSRSSSSRSTSGSFSSGGGSSRSSGGGGGGRSGGGRR